MIQRWSCAVLIVNLRSEMRDMTLNFKRDLSAFYRGKLCITENELKKMLCMIVQKIAQEIVHQSKGPMIQSIFYLCCGGID